MRHTQPVTRASATRCLVLATLTLLLTTACASTADPAADGQPTTPPTTSSQSTVGASPDQTTTEESDSMTAVRISVAGQAITGELHDNPTADDLTRQLPLTLTFRDLNRVEKVAELPQPLTTDGVPGGDDPAIHDIGYYAPSRNLVLYYGDVGYWDGIVRIGRLPDEALDLIQQQPDGFTVTIERAP